MIRFAFGAKFGNPDNPTGPFATLFDSAERSCANNVPSAATPKPDDVRRMKTRRFKAS